MTDRIRWIPNWIPWKRAFVWWGFAKQPTIYIPRKRKSNAQWVDRTLAHERVHVLQWKKLGRVRFLRTYLGKHGRLDLEAEAFAESVRWMTSLWPGSRSYGQPYWFNRYANSLAKKYHLLYTVDECRTAIEGWL